MAFSGSSLTTGFDATAGTTATTASVSPGANRRQFMLLYSFDTSDAIAPEQVSSIAGNGFTWSQLGTTTLSFFATSTYTTRLSLWSAPAIASPTTGTALITFPASQGGIGWAWAEVAEAGNIIQTVVANNALTTTATDTTLSVNFATFGNAGNGAFAGTGQYGWNGDAAITPRSTWTELAEVFNGSVGGLETQWKATSDTAASLTSSLGDWFAIIACEFDHLAVTYTLTATTGTFALSGQNATLRATRNLVATSGTFVLTGQDAALKVSRRLVASPGSFALVGNDANLIVTRHLIADTGNFVLTGQSADLRRGRILQATPGSFILTGQPAQLTVNRRLVTAPGSFVLTGQDASLIISTVRAASHVLDFDVDGTGGTSITTPGITTQAADSGFVVCVGRGTISGHVAPTDSKGNTYSQLDTSHAYTLWPLSGTALYVSLDAASGSSHTFSVTKPNNDETTIAVVEVENGKHVQDFGWNEVLSGSPQTSPSVVTTGPATLIAFRWGDGNLGTQHDATPNNGFTVVDKLITDTTIVQCVVAVKDVAVAGTYNVTWSPVSPSNEGAQHWLVAIQAENENRLVATPGSFVLTGQSATLRVERRLVALPGSFALTGSSVTLTAHRRIVADTSGLVLTGNTATLRVSRRLVAAPATFSLTGNDANLGVVGPPGVLIALPGVFVLTGYPINLIYSPLLPAPTIARQVEPATIELIATEAAIITFSESTMEIARGTAKDLYIPVTNPDGTPYDLTGKPIRVVVKRRAEDIDPVILKDLASGVELVNTHIIVAHYIGVDTVLLSEGMYRYDAWVQDDVTGEWTAVSKPRQFFIYRSISEIP